MKSFKRLSRTSVLTLAAWVSFLLASFGQEPVSENGAHWAILIGAEKYHRANPLKYTINDVRQLAITLKNRGRFDADRVLEMTDDAPNPRFQPLKTNLMTELPNWFRRIGPNDVLLVFFTGHGFRDSNGRLYLAPLDCDPLNASATGVPVEWLREHLAACKARNKLLILDACHAGSEKGDDDADGGIPAKDLGNPFESLAGVMTLASSEAKEKSQIWEEKRQSLFSYWLNQALKGHADYDGNGNVDVHELYDFVFRNVTHTAQARFPRSQTPVRIVRSGTVGVPVIVHLQPQSLRQLLDDIAEQLADNMSERRLAKVGVLEFTNDTAVGELLGANYGALGKWCAGELERKLMQQGAGNFSVVDSRKLQRALKDDGFQLDDLGSSPRLKQLSNDVGGMPVLAVGTLASRKGRVVAIQCKLQSIDSDELAGSAGGRATLNESEWAMLGRSVEIKLDDRRPEPISIAATVPVSIEDKVIELADERSRGPHPLQDAKFRFPVKIMVDGKERKPVFKKSGDPGSELWDCFVPVTTGETYQIWVQNRSGEQVIMRLLVDGLNTRLEKDDAKGLETMVWGKRVNLDEARGWILDPAEGTAIKINGAPTWSVAGFETESGDAGKMRAFTVVDAEKSLAARQNFSEQLGMITAAFYSANSPRSSVGTDAGREINVKIKERKLDVGNLLAVVHIRYVDAKTLQADAKN